jgi:PAS domain S-box-containing protein
MCDRDLRLQIVAGGGMDRVDLDARELIGRTLQDIMPEHQLGRIAAGYRAALNGRQVTLDDVESLRTATRWRTTFVPMRDEHGAITAAMAVARDVTDRAEAVAAARSGEQRLRAALLAMLDPFVLLAAVRDEDGKIVDFVFEYANRAAGVGRIAPESLIGRRLLGFLPKRAASVLFPRYVETVESGEPLELDGFVYEERANGRRTRRVFDVRAVPVENGLAYTWRDVTRRATLEQELMRAREEAARSFARLEAVVDAAPLAIAAVDAEDRISLWSAGAEQTFGWSKDEVLGRPIVILPEGEKAAYDERRVRELSGEPVLGLDGVRHHKDGHTFPVAVNTAPIRDDDGGLVETVVVIVDVTEQKNAERRLLDALERARRTSESKQALMRALAHDVGNPLTVIQGFAHMLEERSDRFDDDQKRMLIGRIRAQAERLLALTSDLLEAERLDDTELTRVETELSQLVIETVAEVDHDGHPVTVDATPVIARIDRVRVRRIVENLVVNAVRHTPAGTRVWVRVERNGDDVLLSVDDAGPGVDPSRRDHLFAAFERGSSSGGAGVGLSLVRRFTLDHGGHAWMEDRPGGGASFKVVLPAV